MAGQILLFGSVVVNTVKAELLSAPSFCKIDQCVQLQLNLYCGFPDKCEKDFCYFIYVLWKQTFS